jgi:hypothetical protein
MAAIHSGKMQTCNDGAAAILHGSLTHNSNYGL